MTLETAHEIHVLSNTHNISLELSKQVVLDHITLETAQLKAKEVRAQEGNNYQYGQTLTAM